jgi:hypothetical protein
MLYQYGAYLARFELEPDAAPERLLRVAGEISRLAADTTTIYWSVSGGRPGAHDRILSAPRTGGPTKVLVSRLALGASDLVEVDGYLYWTDNTGIGRVATDGRHLQRHYIPLRQENGAGVADGLAADDNTLYFSRCQDGTIGRVGVDGGQPDLRFIELPGNACPQSLAVNNGYLYWASPGAAGDGAIGRARLSTKQTEPDWLTVHTPSGPHTIAVDTSHVYWTWGGGSGDPAYIARAGIDHTDVDVRFQRTNGDALYVGNP